MADQLTRDDVLRWLQQDQAWGVLVAPTEWRPVDDEWLNLIHRAVLARWGTSNLTQTRRSPADGEVAELVTELQSMATDADRRCRFSNAERLSRAAELLQQQALVPVSVSERLPGPEDCDSHGWCWVLYSAHSTWTLEPPYGQDGMPTGWTHWLPAHALPLPEADK